MKKTMFNDRYGLTQAVVGLIKTNTRRIEKSLDVLPLEYNHLSTEFQFEYKDGIIIGRRIFNGSHVETYHLKPRYKIGEVVAVAQAYKDSGWNPDVLQETFVRKPTVFPDLDPIETHLGWVDLPFKYHKGWTNKMFVRATLMPHRIRIIDIKVERLRDISEEDCIKEGIEEHYPYIDRNPADKVKSYRFRDKQSKYGYFQLYPVRDCFAVLIDRISGKGTWERNPWVFAYEFELIK